MATEMVHLMDLQKGERKVKQMAPLRALKMDQKMVTKKAHSKVLWKASEKVHHLDLAKGQQMGSCLVHWMAH